MMADSISGAARSLLRTLDDSLKEIDDNGEVSLGELLSLLRVLVKAVRLFVDFDGGMGSVVSVDEMKDAYRTVMRMASEDRTIMPPRGTDPTPEQQAILAMSLQLHAITLLVIGLLTRTGVARDVELFGKDAAVIPGD